jgi:hypothetical protein
MKCCAKCLEKTDDIVNPVKNIEEEKAELEELDEKLAAMKLRERRAFFRNLEKSDNLNNEKSSKSDSDSSKNNEDC